MRKDTTPEERLLRLIKRKKTPSEGTTEEKKGINERKEGLPERSERPAERNDRFAERKQESPAKEEKKEGIPRRPSPKPAFEKTKEGIISDIPKILIILSIGLVIYLIADLLFITPYFRHKIDTINIQPAQTDKVEGETAIPPEDESKKGPAKPYSYYSKDIENRNIFKPPSQSGKKGASAGTTSVKENLNLIGVIAGEELQAAIENKSIGKTYFVYKGEYIDDVLVEDILENKVILNFRGERFELTL